MIWNIPIEPLEGRYSTQWQRWFEKAFNDNNLRYCNVYGCRTSGEINNGSFLDVAETINYKSTQISSICNGINQVKTGDVFFFHDLWHPGVISLAYLIDCLGLKNIKIYGCLHAGSYDEFDFLHQKGCHRWAENFENSLFDVVDKIFVATEFHKKMICKQRKVNKEKIIVTGFPLFDEVGSCNIEDKEDFVVFPHRLNVEKQPDKFDELAKFFAKENWTFVKTKEICNTKSQYYDMLKASKIAVSFANQETWGIAMIESVYANCIPLVPDKLSYSELYPEIFKYNSNDMRELTDKLFDIMNGDKRYFEETKKLKETFKNMAEEAMERLIDELQK